MGNVRREIETTIATALRNFPAVVLTGPRRAGKTHLLRHLLPRSTYVLLEDPDLIARVRADPHGFLDRLELPVILDEAQHIPDLFAHVRARIDRAPRRMGRWILTGSQETPLVDRIGESLAGRAAILQVLPFSYRESAKVDILHGGYPEVIARPRAASLWFSSYLQTYLERDVRAVTGIRDLATFRRFVALVASRHGQILNKTDLAAPLGISVPTIAQWLGVLEVTSQIFIVPPYFENFGKRLVKSPKVFIADPGLARFLLGIESRSELERSPFRGRLFEGLVLSEIVKAQRHRGRRPEVYYFRDRQGLEVDFVVPAPRGGVTLVECKATQTPTPDMATSMQRLTRSIGGRTRRSVEALLVHLPSAHTATTALAPNVRAVAWTDFAASL